jgi:hypothetical protein
MSIPTATKTCQDSNAVDQFVFPKREFKLVDVRASFDERSGASHVRSFGVAWFHHEKAGSVGSLMALAA